MSFSPSVTMKLLIMFKNSGLGSLSMCSPYDVIRDLSFVTCAASGSRDFSIVARSVAVPASLPRDRADVLASRWILSCTLLTRFVCYRNKCCIKQYMFKFITVWTAFGFVASFPCKAYICIGMLLLTLIASGINMNMSIRIIHIFMKAVKFVSTKVWLKKILLGQVISPYKPFNF